jgi:hypothetical protein
MLVGSAEPALDQLKISTCSLDLGDQIVDAEHRPAPPGWHPAAPGTSLRLDPRRVGGFALRSPGAAELIALGRRGRRC